MNCRLFYLVITLCTLHTAVRGQSFDCNSFCVEDIRFDTADPEILIATIYFSAEDNSFINYPHVSAIVDYHGDTIATGTLNFFGQIGNSSQDYPLTPRIDSLPENLEAFLFFQYDTVTCVLTFPCLTSSVTNNLEEFQVNVYPNPVSSEFIIEAENSFEDATINIFNAGGQMVKRLDHLSGDKITIDRGNLPEGFYYVQILHYMEILGVYKVLVFDAD